MAGGKRSSSPGSSPSAETESLPSHRNPLVKYIWDFVYSLLILLETLNAVAGKKYLETMSFGGMRKGKGCTLADNWCIQGMLPIVSFTRIFHSLLLDSGK